MATTTTITAAPLQRAKAVSFFTDHWVLLLCGLLSLLSLRVALKTSWPAAGLAVDPQTVLKVLSPLLLTAGFIERAVEIILSPWRDAQAAVLQSSVDTLKAGALPDDPLAVRALKNQIAEAESKLQIYKGKTQQYAFCASITMGLLASIVGVRALGSFLPSSPTISGAQFAWFKAYDVILTAGLLAGGADGLHSVINMFTTFFDTTTAKTENSAKAPSKQS